MFKITTSVRSGVDVTKAVSMASEQLPARAHLATHCKRTDEAAERTRHVRLFHATFDPDFTMILCNFFFEIRFLVAEPKLLFLRDGSVWRSDVTGNGARAFDANGASIDYHFRNSKVYWLKSDENIVNLQKLQRC